ncbi:MAG: rhamnogalacturonan acetylesterase [Lachnospiraceae bacterium]|nr:rhamnogalacturonan acetylesterase [Lachnospiraceae bacterium]
MGVSYSYRFGRKGISANTRFGNSTADHTNPNVYGFVTDEVAAADPKLQIPELNSGFILHDKCIAGQIINLVDTEHGVKADHDGDGLIPVLFKVDLTAVTDNDSKGADRSKTDNDSKGTDRSKTDEQGNDTIEVSGSGCGFSGNFTVKVEIYAEKDTLGLLFLGRRRLAMKRRFKAGETFTGSYVTNICPIIPRTYTQPMEDTTLDVALVGKGLSLVSVEIAKSDCHTVYIAGDSTVTDQSAAYPYDPALSYSGWGQMLSAFCNDAYAVSNHAHSGLTTESMRSEGHYKILYDRIGKGDICLFQFGHNDQKLDSLKAFEGYTDNLMHYIDEIRSKGAIPVIISPLARNTWKSDNTYNDLLAEYARACEELAVIKGVPYIDLHAFSMGFVTENGRETARRWYYPSDYTHTNDYGAFLFAGFVYRELARLELLTHVSEVTDVSAIMDEWMPPTELPVINLPSNGTEKTDFDKNDIFSIFDRSDDILTRAKAFEMVIKTVKFFPTNVYNDMFDDVVGHETYAGIIECALQNGIIPESMIETVTVAGKDMAEGTGNITITANMAEEDRKVGTAANMAEKIGKAETGAVRKYIHPEKPVMLSEFLAVLRLGYLSRRPEGDVFEKLDTGGLKAEEILTRVQAADICRQIVV